MNTINVENMNKQSAGQIIYKYVEEWMLERRIFTNIDMSSTSYRQNKRCLDAYERAQIYVRFYPLKYRGWLLGEMQKRMHLRYTEFTDAINYSAHICPYMLEDIGW